MLAPSDYQLFLSMPNGFAREKLVPREAFETRVPQFFANRNVCFCENEIMKLTAIAQNIEKKILHISSKPKHFNYAK